MPGVLSIQIRPPIISTSFREMVSPSPVPPCFRVVDMSAWVKAWNSFAHCSGVMPIPVSRTENLNCTLRPVCSSTSTFTQTSPCSVNFTALLTRLVRICPSRNGSPDSRCGIEAATSAKNSSPFSWAFWPVRVATELTTWSKSKSVVSSFSLPASTLEKSKISLMIPSREVPALCTLLT